MIIKGLLSDKRILLISFLFIILLYPFPFWGLLSNQLFASIIGLILALFLFFYKKELNKDEKKLMAFYVFIVILFLFLQYAVHDFSVGGILLRLPIFIYAWVLFMEDSSMKKIMNVIVTVTSLIAIVGLLLFLLFRFGYSLPSLGTIDHYIVTDERSYTIYPFFLLAQTVDLSDIVRFYGVYDEPGVFGTLSVFFLYFLKYNFKDWKVWVITIVGIFTFSFFFYGMFIINSLLRSFKAKGNLLLSILLVLALGLSYQITKDNPALNALIWERFSFEDGKFKGDNRMTDKGEMAFESIKGTKSYWLGLDSKQREIYWEDAQGGASYKNVVANNGMLFFALYVCFFLIYGWCYKQTNITYLLYVLLVVFSLYQRSNIFSLPYMFFYACIARIDEIGFFSSSNKRNVSSLK